MHISFLLLFITHSLPCFSKDFVMHVGGAVWALDWCPRVDDNSENGIEPEVIDMMPSSK